MNIPSDTAACVVWITGFSGAGKSTVAVALQKHFVAAGIRPLVLDGDVMRAIFAREASFTPEARRELAWTYARLCHEAARQGIPVICATISMVHEVRAWNRVNNPLYFEVYLKVPLAERVARDPKGLYARAKTTDIGPMVGMEEAAEEPLSPDLVIENANEMTPDRAAQQIWQLINNPRKIYAKHG